MDPGRFYDVTRKNTNTHILALPSDSDDENLSDEDEYQLPSKTIEESDLESDSEVMETEVVYLEDTDLEDTEVMFEVVEEEEDEPLGQASTSGTINLPGAKSKVQKRNKLSWTEDSIKYDNQDVSFLGCENLLF